MKAQFEKKDLEIKVKRVHGFRGFVPMFHGHGEIILVEKGEVSINIEGEVHQLKAGELCIVFPYIIHSYEDAPDADVIILLFSVSAAKPYEQNLLTTKPESPYMVYTPEMYMMINRMIQFRKPQTSFEEMILESYLHALLGEIIYATGSVEVEEGDLSIVQRILSYCTEHYKEDITGKDVAKACFVSESYVTKIFSGKLCIPFRTYINQLRVSEAKSLLEHTDFKINEIMYSSGFKNQSSFNRIFTEETGMTPKEYRHNFCRQQS